jgi:hypothetical protein
MKDTQILSYMSFIQEELASLYKLHQPQDPAVS